MQTGREKKTRAPISHLNHLGNREDILNSGGPLDGEAVDGAEQDDGEGGHQNVEIPRRVAGQKDRLQKVLRERQRHGSVSEERESE